MQFNNRQFEANVKETMSTLDKFKKSLKMDGVTKGLSEVENMAYKSGFHMQDIWLKTASVFEYQVARRITNAAEKIAKALTIEPVMTGFKEYETQMNAVQTILANTESKGSTLDDVNKALDALNTYADKTIYNFTEMTRNIGTFTAAGVDLQTSVDAIQGIANLAAVSGSTSQQASTAMYQLSQALAAGKVSLMDWNSVVNAGMGGELFQNALLRTSELLKTGGKQAVETYGSFRESLTKGEWLTTEVLTETLKQLSGAYTEAELMSQGFTKEQAKDIVKLSKTASDAATKVKTFSQLWDVMKESVQSGWAQTWKLIIGDFQEAKDLLSPLADFFTKIIGKMSDARNKLLEGALGKTFTSLSKKIKNVLGPIKSATKAVDGAVSAVKNYGDIVDRVIKGEFGNTEKRWNKLTEMGYDWMHVQNLVNEKLGDNYRYTVKTNKAQKDSEKTQQKLGKAEANRLEILTSMSEAELKSMGYSKDQIKTLKELAIEADKLGMSVSEFVENIDKLDGRTILINSFKNAGKGLVSIFKAMKDAWVEIFPPMKSDQLYNIIAALHKFSTHLVVGDETADKLKRTLKGLFAIIDIAVTLVSGPFKMAFKILSQLLGVFDLDILDVTAKIGDAIVKFRDWLDSILDFTKVFEAIKPAIEKVIDGIRNLSRQIRESDFVSDLIAGFVNGLEAGATVVWNALVNFGKRIIQIVKDVLGINSPSTEFISIGKDCGLGFFEGVKEIFKSFGDIVKSIFSTTLNAFKKLDWSLITNELLLFGALFPATRIFAIGAAITRYFGAIGGDTVDGLIEGIKSRAGNVITAIVNLGTNIINAIKGVLGIHSPSTVMITIGKFLISGLILGIVGSKTGLFSGLKGLFGNLLTNMKSWIEPVRNWLANIDWPEIKMEHIIGVGVITGVVIMAKKLLDVVQMFGKGVEGFGEMCSGAGKLMKDFGDRINPQKSKFEETANSVLKMSVAIAILAGSVYVLAQLDTAKLWGAVGAIAALTLLLGGLTLAASKLNVKGGDFAKLGVFLLGLSASLLLMASAIKKLEFLNEDNVGPILLGLAGMVGGMVALLIAFGKLTKGTLAKNIDKASIVIGKISLTMLLLSFAIKSVSKLDGGQLIKGMGVLTIFGAFVVGLIAATKLAGPHIKGLGATLLKLSLSIALLVGVIKLVNGLEPGEMAKGILCMTLFGGLIAGLIATTKLAGSNIKRVGSTLIGISVAMALMALTIKIVSGMSLESLTKGLACITVFGAVIVALVAVISKVENKVKGVAATILAISIAIGVLSAVSIVMSMISLEGLAKGVTAVSMLSGMMALMIYGLKGAEKAKGTIVAMTVMMALLVGAVVGLSFIDSSKLATATAALTSIMGMFALMIASTKLLKNSKQTKITMLEMVGIVAILAGIVVGLSYVNAGSAIQSVTALSILMTSFAASLVILGHVGRVSKSAQQAMLPMLGIVAGLAAILGIMSALNVEGSIPTAVALSILLGAMTGVLAALSTIGAAASTAYTAIGAMAVLGLVVAELALILGVMSAMNVEGSITTAAALSILLGAMTGVLVVLTAIGAFAASSFVAIGAMAVLGIVVAELAVILGVMDHMGVEASIPTARALSILLNGMAIALGILTIIGFGGPAAFVGIAALETLILALVGTFVGLGALVDKFPILETFLDKGIGLLERLAEGIGSIFGKFISGFATSALSGLPEMGMLLSQFMINATPFINGMKSISGETANAARSLAETIAILTAADLLSGITSWLTGGSSIADFGTEIAAFGTHLKAFSDNVAGIDETAVTAAANAGKALAQMADTIPNEGGVAAWFAGENSIASFGLQIATFGLYLKMFSDNVAGINVEAVTAASNAGKALAEMANTIPNKGGMAAWFAGENSIASFGADIASFGKYIKAFSDNVKGIKVESVTAAANAGKALAQMTATVPKKIKLDSFGDGIISFAEDLKSFASKMKGVKVEGAVKQVNMIVDLAGRLKGISGAFDNFESSLKKLGSESVSKFVKSFTGSHEKIKSAVKKFVDAGKKAARGKYEDFQKAGKYLVEGFAKGITDNTFKAEAKAKAMAKAAYEAAKKELDEHSPSRKFYKVGDFAGKGFVNALTDYVSKAYESGKGLAKSATRGLNAAMYKVQNMLDNGVDTQPTIRPVLDLSGISDGVGAINGMFGMHPSVGVLSNLGSINATMNARQNGSDDVASAISKLGRSLNNMGGNTYNINGVTYDDGSNISDAVETIIRAARIERRV